MRSSLPLSLQVQVEWSQLFGSLSHGEDSFIEVMQGPNLNMLELLLEEAPSPHDGGSLPTNETPNLTDLSAEESPHRPIVDLRRSAPASRQNNYVVWNELFEFERLKEDTISDEVEQVRIDSDSVSYSI
jgi:hypothetical protein